MATTCDQLHLIHAYHDGELSPERAGEVESHMRGCAVCEAELASLRAMSLRLRAIALPAMPVDLPARVRAKFADVPDGAALRLASWLTAAAAMVIAASLVWLGAGSNPTSATKAGPMVAWERAAISDNQRITQTSSLGEEFQLAQELVDDLSMQLALNTDNGKGRP